jgi:hypothetical protein
MEAVMVAAMVAVTVGVAGADWAGSGRPLGGFPFLNGARCIVVTNFLRSCLPDDETFLAAGVLESSPKKPYFLIQLVRKWVNSCHGISSMSFSDDFSHPESIACARSLVAYFSTSQMMFASHLHAYFSRAYSIFGLKKAPFMGRQNDGRRPSLCLLQQARSMQRPRNERFSQL